MLGVGGTPSLFAVGTHVDDFDVFDVEFQACCHAAQTVGVAQEDGLADAFLTGLHGCLHHGLVLALGIDDSLRMGGSRGVQVARELRLLSEQLLQVLLVRLPVGNLLACHATLYGSLGNGSAHLGDESRVYGLRDEVFRSEGEVVDVVYLVDHVGNGLLGEVGDGEYGSHLHLLVDGGSVHVEGSAEDVGESDDVVDLVGIVAAAGRHQHVGACSHGVLVGNLRNGVGKCEDDGVVSHRAHHVLAEDVALGQTYEHVGTLDGLFQRVHVAAVGGEERLLLRQVGAVGGDDTLRVEHEDVLLACAERHV